ncbi:hypothetical protein ACEV75_03960 [Vibrio parahaemolyticus]
MPKKERSRSLSEALSSFRTRFMDKAFRAKLPIRNISHSNYQGIHMLNDSKPFILNYATERVHSNVPTLDGHYCDTEHMWVDDESNTPIINLVDKNCSELLTKTNVQVESDDQSYALEMQTKTKVEVERDDNDINLCHLTELLTKTDVIQESDDNSHSFGMS